MIEYCEPVTMGGGGQVPPEPPPPPPEPPEPELPSKGG